MDEKILAGLEKVNQLSLSSEEKARIIDVFARLKTGEDALNAFDLDSVERMVHVIPLTNILREDVSSQPFSREDLLRGAPEADEEYWQVPRLVE